MSDTAPGRDRPQQPSWILIDVSTGHQTAPPLRFPERAEAESYHRRAFQGSPRYEIREVSIPSQRDPVAV
ncbi:MAG TPA: hypothetical protein VNY34_00080 [Solirubrobacteraceae bacterium]|nr:hypothetical protein [Solirubrobacteraceae bacterium]